MYKSRLLLFLFLFSTVFGFAQAPQGIQFQTVVRDVVGTPLNSATVTLAFRIQNASAVTQYHETHTVTTDNFGLANVVI